MSNISTYALALARTYPLQGVWHGKATSESYHRQSRKDVEVEPRLEELPLAVYPQDVVLTRYSYGLIEVSYSPGGDSSKRETIKGRIFGQIMSLKLQSWS
jgi:hypothetical protein